MMPYKTYLEIKNKYCIYYFGVFNEFIHQLIRVRPVIERTFPGIELYIGCKDELKLLKDKVVYFSEFNPREFSYCKELKLDNINYPLEQFLLESNVNLNFKKTNIIEKNKRCVLITNNLPPVKSLTNEQIEKIIKKIEYEGYSVDLNGEINDAGWVVGVESEKLCLAAENEIRTSLIPTGLGTKFFQKLYPNMNLFELPTK